MAVLPDPNSVLPAASQLYAEPSKAGEKEVEIGSLICKRVSLCVRVCVCVLEFMERHKDIK